MKYFYIFLFFILSQVALAQGDKVWFKPGGTSTVIENGEVIVGTDTVPNSGFRFYNGLTSPWYGTKSWLRNIQPVTIPNFMISDSLLFSAGRQIVILNADPASAEEGGYMNHWAIDSRPDPGILQIGGNRVMLRSWDSPFNRALFLGVWGDSPTVEPDASLYSVSYSAFLNLFKSPYGYALGPFDSSVAINATQGNWNTAQSVLINVPSQMGGADGGSSFGTDRGRYNGVFNTGYASGQHALAMNGALVSGIGSVGIAGGHANGLYYDYGIGSYGHLNVNGSSIIALGSGDVGDAVDDYRASAADIKGSYNISLGWGYVGYRPMTLNLGSGNRGDAPYATTIGNTAVATMPGEFSFMAGTLKQVDQEVHWGRVNKDSWLYLHGETPASTTDTISIMGQDNNQRFIEGWAKFWQEWTKTSTLVTAYVIGKTARGIKTAAYRFSFVIRSVDNVSLPDTNHIAGLEKVTLFSNGDMDIAPQMKSLAGSPELYWMATGDSSGPTKWMIKMEYQTLYW